MTESSDDNVADRPSQHVIFLVSNYSFTRLNDNRYINNAQSAPALHPAAQPKRSPSRSSGSISSTSSSDSRTGFLVRAAAAASPWCCRRERTEVFVGTRATCSREETLDLPASLPYPEARRSEHHRSTNYLTVRYNSENERLRFVQTLYAQPRLDRPGGLPAALRNLVRDPALPAAWPWPSTSTSPTTANRRPGSRRRMWRCRTRCRYSF